MIAQRARVVREYDGAARNIEDLAHDVVADMRAIDDHAEIIHARDHITAESERPFERGASVALSTQSSVALWQSIISRTPSA